MSRFFVYEEYGARYESMLYDMTLTSKNIPNFQEYERGIEALASTLAPISTREDSSKKGLTFGDLLIKVLRLQKLSYVTWRLIFWQPLQRICKYPLLFADLHKVTPVIDCPESHAEVEKALFRLRETAMEINKATNDEYTRERIQRTWMLQDLLNFGDPVSVTSRTIMFIAPQLTGEFLQVTAPFRLRSLGHPTLCGVLYVTYQSVHRVIGKYMLCALFKSCLILAVPRENSRHYLITASISLIDLRMETADNGKGRRWNRYSYDKLDIVPGLQCHAALFSWKIVFESDQQLFEIILSACSPQEEDQWSTTLSAFSMRESQYQFDDRPISPAQYSMLALDIKSIGNVLGQPGTLARRISVQRAATVGPRTNVCQVFIKNTHALRDDIATSGVINVGVGRSQSLLSTNRIPVLAPKRVDRIRMEYDLSKVWTRETLPYPGMGGNRGENLIRVSTSMMRRLSRASITSGFSKRSASFNSLTNSKFDDALDSIKGLTKPNIDNASIMLPSGSDSCADRIDSLGMTALHQVVPPERTSSRRWTRSKGHRMRTRSEMATASAQASLGPMDAHALPLTPTRTLKNRWSSPISLLRSISTEGMKCLFVWTRIGI